MECDFIRENLAEIRERIEKSAKTAGLDPEKVNILAVSKTFGRDLIRCSHDNGIRHLGESYIQEAEEKIAGLDLDCRWHFIGHLQKNKVRRAVRLFDVIESVDSPELLARIDGICGEENKTMEVLLQVNIAGEESKFGMDPKIVIKAMDTGADCTNVKIIGLMLIPPFYDDPEKNRGNFSGLRELSEKIEGLNYPNWENKYLSMGMTDDFEIAIQEGANLVRIGRAIFGSRRRN